MQKSHLWKTLRFDRAHVLKNVPPTSGTFFVPFTALKAILDLSEPCEKHAKPCGRPAKACAEQVKPCAEHVKRHNNRAKPVENPLEFHYCRAETCQKGSEPCCETCLNAIFFKMQLNCSSDEVPVSVKQRGVRFLHGGVHVYQLGVHFDGAEVHTRHAKVHLRQGRVPIEHAEVHI